MYNALWREAMAELAELLAGEDPSVKGGVAPDGKPPAVRRARPAALFPPRSAPARATHRALSSRA
ncbi:hypothetical protein EON68_01470 [archaeon]|nr:MAG: hypothetical protein EON68_01470 [archaeon]